MKCKFVAFIFSLFMCSFVSASEFSIPDSFDFLAIDGKDVGGWGGSERSINLAAGEHKIALEFSAAIDGDNPRMQEFVKSEPLLITLVVEQGKRYRLVPHSSVKTSPTKFAENPVMKVMSGRDDANADIAMLVQNNQSKWAKVTQSNNTSSPSTVSDMARITGTTDPVRIDSIGGTPAASMLVYWWNQSDQQTRDSFLKQINQ